MFDAVESYGAYVKYGVGGFAHLNDALAVAFCGDKVQVAHFGDGMSYAVVDGAVGELSSVKVGYGQVKYEGGGGYGQHFVAVTQNYNQVGL